MTTRRAIALLTACAALFVGIGLAVGRPTFAVEGGYFLRTQGSPSYASVFNSRGPGVFDPSDGNLWIGGGLALLGLAAILLIASLRSSTRG